MVPRIAGLHGNKPASSLAERLLNFKREILQRWLGCKGNGDRDLALEEVTSGFNGSGNESKGVFKMLLEYT